MSRARPTQLYSEPTGAHSLRARSLRAHRLRARSSLRALTAYGHRSPTGFHSLRARRQPTVRRVASGSSTAALVLFVRLLVALRRQTLARTPADEGGGAVDHTAQARRRGLRVSPGVVGRRGNRGAYVPRVRCVVPIGRIISPYHPSACHAPGGLRRARTKGYLGIRCMCHAGATTHACIQHARPQMEHTTTA